MRRKPSVAFFDFTSCEGCQLQVINLGETLFDILGIIDLKEFREVMSETWEGELDIAIVEGSVTDLQGEQRIKRIRERSKVIIAYGSCATIGGVNGIKNAFPLSDIGQYVYGDDSLFFPSEETRAVHQVVKVDYFVHGCPIYLPEFLTVLKAAVRGIPYTVPDYPVCVECKLNEHVCMYDRGVSCLGPVTRAGCNSWCLNNGNICYGCRGMVSNPNEEGIRAVLKKYHIPWNLIVNRMNMYDTSREREGNA